MKLTLQLKSFLEEQTIVYSKELSMESPLVIFTDEELKEIEPSANKRYKSKKQELGASWAKGNVLPDRDVIWINVDNSDYLWQLIDTVVHELIHLKCPAQEHGDEFQEVVNSVIMGRRILMACPNITKVKFIKMHDTKFYCCQTMKDNLAGLPMAEYYYKQLEYIKYCPFCGTPMGRNYGT